MRLDIKKIVILYFILCLLDSIIVRNLKKKILFSRAVKLASSMNKELVVLGSPHLGLVDGGVISFVTEKTIGPVYGCGDTHVLLTSRSITPLGTSPGTPMVATVQTCVDCSRLSQEEYFGTLRLNRVNKIMKITLLVSSSTSKEFLDA